MGAGSNPAGGLFRYFDRSDFRAVFLLHEFREVVAVSAKRLTDRQKKKIVADYVQLQSYRAAAKLNDVSDATVKKVVKEDPESARLCAQKKREN